jgi:hypothetical protein
VNCFSSERKWMFCDVGMIYVFYCFECGHTEASTEFY